MASQTPTPDLAAILATLAGLNQPNQQTQQSQQVQHPTENFQSPPYMSQPIHQPPPQQWNHQARIYPNSGVSTPVIPSNPNVRVIDPATIVDWTSGLKCIMRTVAKNENIIHDVRRMIKSQHEHEQQWWKARQELIEKQKARTEGQKKLDEVLKLVGGATSEGATNTSPEELAKELETFDMKVYRAQTQMMREFTAKLKSLGVPFFGTKAELIKLARKEGAADTPPQGVKDGKVIIDEVELIQLQKKMITILEDLCAE